MSPGIFRLDSLQLNPPHINSAPPNLLPCSQHGIIADVPVHGMLVDEVDAIHADAVDVQEGGDAILAIVRP